MEETPVQASRFSRFSIRKVGFGVVLLAVLIGGLGYYFSTKASRTQDPQKAAEAEAQQWVAVVGKLMVLPEGELPIIATVADPAKLQDQPFFAHAKKGDKVLIYNAARKAILYSPDQNKVIDVAPLNIGAQTTPTPTK